MLKTMGLISVAAAAALALPALAGSPGPRSPRSAIATTSAAPPAAGFEYVGGDAGWVLSQHKYVFAGGRLAMSDESDHAIRIVKAPTPAEIETARTLRGAAAPGRRQLHLCEVLRLREPLVNGYAIEGHVPVREIRRLLRS